MGDRRSKQALFDAFAEVARALASGRRAEIVDILAQGPRSVEEVAVEIDQSVANTSHHLRTLAGTGLVRSSRAGTRVIYRLAGPDVIELWRAVRAVAEEHAGEVERLARAYLGDGGDVVAIDRAELERRLHRSDTIVLDVRPVPEYAAGHIAGARSVPVPELARRLKEIPKGKRVVAYCRGPYCVYADDAVRLLRRNGYRAERLEDGFPEWRAAGLPVEEGDG